MQSQKQISVPTPTPPVKEKTQSTRKSKPSMTTKEFKAYASDVKTAVRNYATLARTYHARSSKGESVNVKLDDGTELSASTMRGMITSICHAVDDLSDGFASSVGKKKASTVTATTNGSLKKMMIILDNMAGFLMESNKGNGLAAYMVHDTYLQQENLGQILRLNGSDPAQQKIIFNYITSVESTINGSQLSEEQALTQLGSRQPAPVSADSLRSFVDINNQIGSFMENRVSSPNMINELVHLIIKIGDFKSKNFPSRVNMGGVFMKYFNTPVPGDATYDTNYTVLGQPIAEYEQDALTFLRSDEAMKAKIVSDRTGDKYSPDRKNKAYTLYQALSDYRKTAIESIAGRPAKVKANAKDGSVPVPTFIPEDGSDGDNHGITWDMIMALNSKGRVHSYYTTDQQKATLADMVESNKSISDDITAYLKSTRDACGNILK